MFLFTSKAKYHIIVLTIYFMSSQIRVSHPKRTHPASRDVTYPMQESTRRDLSIHMMCHSPCSIPLVQSLDQTHRSHLLYSSYSLVPSMFHNQTTCQYPYFQLQFRIQLQQYYKKGKLLQHGLHRYLQSQGFFLDKNIRHLAAFIAQLLAFRRRVRQALHSQRLFLL